MSRLVQRLRHRAGYVAGGVLGGGLVALLLSPVLERWRTPGPANTGHAGLACAECHRPAPGTLRQQLQANARHLVGLRAEPADFGLLAVGSADCIDCHPRATERHPIYRFLEPRFAAARRAVAPERCTSCHREHTGRRVTVEPGFCRHCHQELRVVDDRTQPSHEGIVAVGGWDTCLRCHDFHGNHAAEPPLGLVLAATPEAVEGYLSGGASPFAGPKRHAARERRPR